MGTSSCIHCDGTKKVYKEGFYPCPDCNPESNEYRFRGQVRLLCEDIARKEDIIEKLEVENRQLRKFIKIEEDVYGALVKAMRECPGCQERWKNQWESLPVAKLPTTDWIW